MKKIEVLKRLDRVNGITELKVKNLLSGAISIIQIDTNKVNDYMYYNPMNN